MKPVTERSKRTRQVRLPADLSEMLSVIAWHGELTIPSIIEPMIRPAVEKRFAALPESLRTLAKERMEAKS